MNSPGIITCLRTLALAPKVFFKEYITQEYHRPHYGVAVFSAIVLPQLAEMLCVYGGAKYMLKQLPELVTLLARWFWPTAFAVLFVKVLTIVTEYVVTGWWMKLSIMLAGGQATSRQARTIGMYAYSLGGIPKLLSVGLFFLYLPFICLYPITICLEIYPLYCGVRELTGTAKKQTIFWICVLSVVSSLLITTLTRNLLLTLVDLETFEKAFTKSCRKNRVASAHDYNPSTLSFATFGASEYPIACSNTCPIY